MTDKDSLAKVCADLRALKGNTLDYVARIERLDAEHTEEMRLCAKEYVNETEDLRIRVEEFREELRACRLLLSLPRVRALFPPLPDGAVLASCSVDVHETQA